MMNSDEHHTRPGWGSNPDSEESPRSPLADRHDPREHYRQLVVEMLFGLTERLAAFANGCQSGDIVAASAAGQQLGLWVGQQMSEANRLGRLEGQEQQDITTSIFQGAIRLLSNGPAPGAPSPVEAITLSRQVWAGARQQLLDAQALDDAKRHAEAEALMNEVGDILSASKP